MVAHTHTKHLEQIWSSVINRWPTAVRGSRKVGRFSDEKGAKCSREPAIARPRHRHRRERIDAAVTAMSVSSSSSKRPSRTPRPRLATCSGQVAVGDAMRHGACDGRVQLRQLPSCALVLLAECHHHRGHWDGRRRRKKALARKRLARAHPILTVHGSVPTVLGVHIVMQK